MSIDIMRPTSVPACFCLIIIMQVLFWGHSHPFSLLSAVPLSGRPVLARIIRDLLTDDVTARSHFEDMHGALGVQLLPANTRPRV